jgi:hypothetical protein
MLNGLATGYKQSATGYHGPVAQFSFLPTGESKDLATDIQSLFDDLARALPAAHRAYSGECQPPHDVVENDAVVEVPVDLSEKIVLQRGVQNLTVGKIAEYPHQRTG